MKTEHWKEIGKAFRDYTDNLDKLKNMPYPTVSGVDYSRPAIMGDKSQNGSEKAILSDIEKRTYLEKRVNLVKHVIDFLEAEGYGRERYVYECYFRHKSNYQACDKIGISERTGKYWKRDIFYKAEFYAEKLGIV